MTSTFKNAIPRRKYRERAQPAAREQLGLLEKKKDYKQRAKNAHEKEDKLNVLKRKAELKNEDEFYFKMLRGKRNEEGKFIELDESDSDLDEKEYRRSLKTENYNIVRHQRSMIVKKIDRLKNELHMTSLPKVNSHTLFLDTEQQLRDFQLHQHFQTTPELARSGLLDVRQGEEVEIQQGEGGALKSKYNRFGELLQKQRKLNKLMIKIGYEKNLLGKERSVIKKYKDKKIHKFFLQRKK